MYRSISIVEGLCLPLQKIYASAIAVLKYPEQVAALKVFLTMYSGDRSIPVTTHNGIRGHCVAYHERRPLIGTYGENQELSWFVIAPTTSIVTVRTNGPESKWILSPPARQVKSSFKHPTHIADLRPVYHCQSIREIWCTINPAPTIGWWQKGSLGRVLSTSV